MWPLSCVSFKVIIWTIFEFWGILLYYKIYNKPYNFFNTFHNGKHVSNKVIKWYELFNTIMQSMLDFVNNNIFLKNLRRGLSAMAVKN